MIAVMTAAEEDRIAKALEKARIASDAEKTATEHREAKQVAKELSDVVFREDLLTRVGSDLKNKSKWQVAYHFDDRLPEGTRFISVAIPVPSEMLRDYQKIGEFIRFVCRIIKETYGKHPMFGGRVDDYYLNREWHEIQDFKKIVVTIWDKNLSAV